MIDDNGLRNIDNEEIGDEDFSPTLKRNEDFSPTLKRNNISSLAGMQTPALHTHYYLSYGVLQEEIYIGQFSIKRQNLGISTHCLSFKVLGKYKDILKEYLSKENYTVISGENHFVATSNTAYISVMRININGTNKNLIKIAGDYDETLKIKKEFVNKYKSAENQIYIDWKFLTLEGIRTLSCPLDSEQLPVQEMYPFLSCSLTDYYKKFVESKSNILILKGPPGTGKTTFIKGLLNFTKSTAIFAQDEGLLSKDALFVDFFESNTKFLVCEDADAFLTPRCEGNRFVHKFLNVAEGLISSKNKKIILTTNLSSNNDIDQALIRPGRCFDVLDFPELNVKEAEVLAKKFELDLEFSNKTFTVAEILNNKKNNQKTKSIGFC